MPCASAESVSEKAEYVEGEIVISTSMEITDSSGLLQTASDSDTLCIDFDDEGIEEIREIETYSGDENIYLAEVDGNVEKICKELNQYGDITAEPNYILHTTDFTMPREISGNLSMYANYQKWYYNDILHIPEALQKHEVTGAGVTVAVIDDGFDINATDFPVNLWRNSQGTVGWNIYKNSDDIAPIYKSDGSEFDNTSHGSNVAGIIGMPPNSKGGIGAAYGAELMLIQAANYNSDKSAPTFTNASVASAIDYAHENGADIINLSLGSSTNVSAISSAITRAVNDGIIVIASAGNEGKATSAKKFYPASLTNVIGVMAIDKDNPSKLASFSNYDVNNGQYYNIAAPGVKILGCKNSSQYTLNNGTSQAAPLVAAACALYMEKYPDNTAAQLKSDMLASATETVTASSSTSYTYKSLNVLKFLDYFEDSHVWSEWASATAPTCTEQGTETRTCPHCSRTETRYIEPLGHSYTDTTTPPSCETDGSVLHICDRCGYQYSDIIPATGHSYTEEILQLPDCTNDGLKRLTCHCGDTYTEAIPATGHTYNEEILQPPDCTNEGLKELTCYCGDTYTEAIPATGHTYTEETVQPADCTNDGLKRFTCHCGDTYTEVIPAAGHSYTEEFSEATCTQDGYRKFTCHCGDTYTEVIPATGHSYTEEFSEATCTQDGYRKFTCHCGDTYTETFPATGHSYTEESAEATCTQDGYRKFTCHCGDTYTEIIPATGHSYTGCNISVYPSEAGNGLLERECTICHETETLELGNAIINCDFNNSILLSGLHTGITAEEFLLNNTVDGPYEISVTPSYGSVLGTGSEITVTYAPDISITYSIVIFGDVNGDGICDGTDSVIISCITSRLITPAQAGPAVYMAADCNHDGAVSILDVRLADDAGLLRTDIDQSVSEEEEELPEISPVCTAESAASEIITDEPTEPQLSGSLNSRLIELIKKVIDIITKFLFNIDNIL